jgi:8-oxo-dGTP diphosphatase
VVIDLGFRIAYRVAYRMMRVYWRLTHASTHGALVALWHNGKILLVKNSYVPYWSLPGGYVNAGESAIDAALRELKEEVGLEVPASKLIRAVDLEHEWEGKREHVEIFSLEVDAPPSIAVDHREVVAAHFFRSDEALRLDLFPPIRRHITERMAAAV